MYRVKRQHTEFGIIGACFGDRSVWAGVGERSTSRLSIRTTLIPIAFIAKVSGAILWGRRGPGASTLTAGGTSALIQAANLQLSQFLLKVGDIFAAFADVGIALLLDEGVVGRCPHLSGGLDQGLLPPDLMFDRGDKLVAFHDGQLGRVGELELWEVCGGGEVGGEGFRGALVDRGGETGNYCHGGKCYGAPRIAWYDLQRW